MTPEAVVTPEPTPAGMGTFSRITGVFFEPGKTFEDIGRRPSWLVPVLLAALVTAVFFVMVGQRVGFDRVVRQQLTTNARAAQAMEQVPADQRDARIATQARIFSIAYPAGSFIMTPIIILISSAVVLAMTAMMSAGLRFKQVFAVVAFAGLPLVIKQLLSIVVVFLKNPDDFNIQNPLAFNFAAFMDPVSSSKFLYTLALTFDLFAIWVIILTGIGLSAAAGKKRLSTGGGIFAAATPWLVFGLFGAAMAGMFS